MEQDQPIGGYLLLDTKLKNTLKDHLKTSEGVEPRIHIDDNGVPSVGIGIALGSQKNGKVTLFPRDDMNMRIIASGSSQRISEIDYKNLENAVIENNDKNKEKRNAFLDKIPLKLTNREMGQQLDNILNQRLMAAEKDAQKAGVNLAGTPQGIKLAIADLNFRGGTNLVFGKKAEGTDFNTTQHLKDGKFGAFLAETLYASNAEGFAGNDRRNQAITQKALEGMSPEQRKEAILKIKGWRKNNPEQVAKVHKRVRDFNDRNENAAIKLDEFIEEIGLEPTPGDPSSGGEQPNSTGAGGSVQVDAHTREGNAVKSHTRSLPN